MFVWQRCQRLLWLMLALGVLLFAAPVVHAARPTLFLEQVKSGDMTVVTATIHGVKTRFKKETTDSPKFHNGFRFGLAIEEVIRRGKLPRDTRDISIAFSDSGYATNWEFGAVPKDGMKVLVHLQRTESGEWEPYPNPGGIVVLDGFDNPRVRLMKRIVALWEIDGAENQLKTVLAGLRDKDAGFQSHCISTLWRGQFTGTDLSSVCSSEMALSHIWEVYTSPQGISLEAVEACQGVFWNTFRGRGWEVYPPTYPIHLRALRTVINERRQLHHNHFDYSLIALCYFAEHGRENFQLLSDVIDGPIDDYKSGTAMRFSLVYQPNTTDTEAQAVNVLVLNKLRELVSQKASSSAAWGASHALKDIALDYARVGAVPIEIRNAMNVKTANAADKDIEGRLISGLRDAQAIQQPSTDAKPLAYPWDNLLDKKVVVYARTCFTDGSHGASAEFRHQRLWIGGLREWPDSIRGGTPVLIEGILTKVNDLEVFRFRAGQPFEKGLPVPEGFSLERASQRYVLLNASWKTELGWVPGW